jgi:hypothetical protein
VKITTHLHLLPRSKNAWSYISTPQNINSWRGAQLKHRGKFTFTLDVFTMAIFSVHFCTRIHQRPTEKIPLLLLNFEAEAKEELGDGNDDDYNNNNNDN